MNYVEQVPNKINVYKTNDVKQKKTKKKRRNSTKSESSENEEEYNNSFSMSNMGYYFRKTYNTISDYVPSFQIFGDDYEDDDSADRKKIRKPKLKKSTYINRKKPLKKIVIQEKNNNRWYDKFFFGSESDEDVATVLPITKVTTEPGFFSWFSSSEEEITANSNIQQHSKPLDDQKSKKMFCSKEFSK